MNPGRIRIVVADDERDLVEVLAARLEGSGRFEVAKAYDGEQALAVASTFSPDVVLIDKLMPRMDGWEACRRLREDPRTSRAAIVIMSAEIVPNSDESARLAGADLFVAKPYDDAALLRLLQDVAADAPGRA